MAKRLTYAMKDLYRFCPMLRNHKMKKQRLIQNLTELSSDTTAREPSLRAFRTYLRLVGTCSMRRQTPVFRSQILIVLLSDPLTRVPSLSSVRQYTPITCPCRVRSSRIDSACSWRIKNSFSCCKRSID